MIQVIKRDGNIVNFDGSKIEKAIIKAMNDVGEIDTYIAEHISKKIESNKCDTTIENIQDEVERLLMQNGLFKVAKAYITYRYEHSKDRDKSKILDDKIKSILDCSNITNDNANVDQYSFSGKDSRVGEEVSKQYALDNLIRPTVVAARKSNYIYIHDLSKYASGMHNCFGKETKFITNKGTSSFEDFKDGDIIEVLTHNGEWKSAKVRNYGEQQLYDITFKKGGKGKSHTIRATKNHRWLLKNKTETTELKVGDYLISTPNIFEFNFDKASQEEKDMWCQGFVVADGTIEYKKDKKTKEYKHSERTRVRLCGDKIEHLDKFIECGYTLTEQQFENGDVIVKCYENKKKLPNVEEMSRKELIAFIHGLYDADGTKACRKTSGKQIFGIQFTNKELIEFVNNYFEVAGLYITSRRDKTGQKTNYATRKETVDFSLTPIQDRYNWKVVEITEDITEDVWCLEVEDNHTFVLSGGIVTGNCLFADVGKLLRDGFETRNGGVRGARSIRSAMQNVAVIFQAQSQGQFGGVGSSCLDYELAPFIKYSVAKHFKKGLRHSEHLSKKQNVFNGKELSLKELEKFKEKYPLAYEYTLEMLDEEGQQHAEALYHNLNTLESRPGSQVPFTSINFGLDTSEEGRLISKWLLKASLEGVGKNNKTSIFPISIFQRKKGINDKPGTPNYDLYELAKKSLSKRIYPNIVNCDWSMNKAEEGNPYTEMATINILVA